MNKFSSTLIVTAAIASLSVSHVSAATVNIDVRNQAHPAPSLGFVANAFFPVPTIPIPTASGVHPVHVPNGIYTSFWVQVPWTEHMVVCYNNPKNLKPLHNIFLQGDDKSFDLILTVGDASPRGASCFAKGG